MSRDRIDAVFELATEGAAEDSLSMRIRGGCMAPSLPDGASIAVRHTRLLLPGDVIVFRGREGFVAHRLLGWVIRDGAIGLVTRGDHCERHDGVVTIDRLVGRIEAPVTFGVRIRAAASFVALVLRRLAGR